MTTNICKVLLVDDDEDGYIVTRDFLSEAELLDFELTWVDNYDAALLEISRKCRDIYLFDFNLGKENGLELMQAALSMGCTKPIILLTGVADREIDQKALALGASDYIGHSEANGFWEFYVSDTGVGIEERHFEKIFQVFQTLVPRDQSESTGVELAIVKKIVELYGGKVWVQSEINQGSTFYFRLPVTPDMHEVQTA